MGVEGIERGEKSTGNVQNDDIFAPTPRLAKSTLTLIPLLGTHEVIFAFVMDEHARGTLRFIKLLTELSFTSFQVTSRLGTLPVQVPGWGRGRGQPVTTQMAGLRLGGKWPLPKIMQSSWTPQVS